MFQSPERIHAFGNADATNDQGELQSFNPQRGFMLLGTRTTGDFALHYNGVSIPREDSCFWERKTYAHSLGDDSRFQSPERIHAFGNTSLHVMPLFQMHRFQSPERIHAFGNQFEKHLTVYGANVSIPREDSCFWEPCRCRRDSSGGV